MDAPERIYRAKSPAEHGVAAWGADYLEKIGGVSDFHVEYISADLVEARIAEAVKAEREACAAVADDWAKSAEVEAEKPGYRATSRMSKLDYAYKFRRISDEIRARGN